jgi:major membrane immunogen (membrane-anchored lipoprotein)
MKRLILFILFASLLLTACGASSAAGPEKAVEAYLNALNEKDSTRLSTLSCADWEATAHMELDSFQAVSTTLEGLSCAQTGTNGDKAIVKCQGKIVASYNGELQDFDLSVRTYIVENSTGEWLVCGEQ